jgi:F-type H+-transporting ATPase subunit epsilon
MAGTLRLEIVTPEARAYSDDVELVVLPAVEGEMGVYPNHIPLITQLKPGELVVTQNGKQTALAVGEGFVEVTGTKVSVLVDMALKESEIDESAADQARRGPLERAAHRRRRGCTGSGSDCEIARPTARQAPSPRSLNSELTSR